VETGALHTSVLFQYFIFLLASLGDGMPRDQYGGTTENAVTGTCIRSKDDGP
jgi:hypothetical protein